MKWIAYQARDLQPAQWEAWRALLREAPHFSSPYFTPDYTQQVAAVLPNIEVAFLYDDERLEAIFPYERVASHIAIPVGRELSDYHGVIYRRHFEWDVAAMLRTLGLKQWKFDHLFPMEGPLAAWCWTEWESPQVDFTHTEPDYWTQFCLEHKKLRHSVGRKEKKLAKEVGQVEHRQDLIEPDLLRCLLDWKCKQYEVAGRVHPFRQEWVREFLLQSLQRDSNEYQGRLSGLFAGAKPIALEYSLHASPMSHMLLCAYDSEYGRYSPGLMRNLKLLEAGPGEGLNTIDFGKGLDEYKQVIMNTAPRLGEGSVDLRPVWGGLRNRLQRSRYQFLRSEYSHPTKQIARQTATQLPYLRRLLGMR